MPPAETPPDEQFQTIIAENISSMSGEPSEPSDGHLLIVQDDRGRRRIILENEIYSVGRDPDCNIRLYSQFVSRHHATLMRIDYENGTNAYRIIDGTPEGQLSANGLMINGRKFKTYDLQNEEEIVFGPQVRAIYYRIRRAAVQE